MTCAGMRLNYARFPAVLGLRVVMLLQPSVVRGKERGFSHGWKYSPNEKRYFVRENDFVTCQLIKAFEISQKRNEKQSTQFHEK